MQLTRTLPAVIGLAILAGTAQAAPVSISAVMTPQEQIKMDFGDGTKHFVLAVRRTGTAKGEGAFAGASVTEIGWHDINPPSGGDPRGYLQMKMANGDVAVVKFTVRAVFMNNDGKTELFDNGVWELVSGTGQFANMRGLGPLEIHNAGGAKREFTLEGRLLPAP